MLYNLFNIYLYLKDNTEVTDERITSDALPYLRQLQSKERAIADGMTSSVIIHDSILSRQQLPNNDEIAEVSY